jgi:hypothetical protein
MWLIYGSINGLKIKWNNESIFWDLSIGIYRYYWNMGKKESELHQKSGSIDIEKTNSINKNTLSNYWIAAK